MRFLSRFLVLACVAIILAGCGSKRVATTPVSGTATYKGKPLKFGSVLFQPEVGPPATGTIQPDGTFTLSTYTTGDGAVVGKNRVQVSCSDKQDPNAPKQTGNVEQTVGKSLIPQKYTNYSTSGLEIDVKPGMSPVPLDLKD